jgi:hypothetical protein
MAGVAGNQWRAGALALAMAFTPAALAAEPPANQNTAPQQTTAVTAQAVSVKAAEGAQILEATNLASDYSKKTGGIGIVIVYGGAPGMPSADEIGRRLIGEFNKKTGGAFEVSYFVVSSSGPGAAAGFAIEDVVIGPFGGKDAFANIDRAIALRNGANNVLAYNSP